MNYNVYSKFDIDKHATHFIDYLEIVISADGDIHYAVPSHQIFLERLLASKIGCDKFKSLIDNLSFDADYTVWLCEQTNCCLVWNNFYICGKNGLTKEQKNVLQKLKSKKYKLSNSTLYQGKIY